MRTVEVQVNGDPVWRARVALVRAAHGLRKGSIAHQAAEGAVLKVEDGKFALALAFIERALCHTVHPDAVHYLVEAAQYVGVASGMDGDPVSP